VCERGIMMKKAVIGVGLLLCGAIGFSTQRIVDTLFAVHDFTAVHSGFNLIIVISAVVAVSGVIMCILSRKEK